MARTKVAIIGSGNIGTDLMMKILRLSPELELAALVGIDPQSDGLKRAQRLGVRSVDNGLRGLLDSADFADIELVFDATSAAAHTEHDRALRAAGKRVIDLTPAAIGPFCVPVVNLDENIGARNVNLVTCGGQATIPMVAAVAGVAPVHYAEIVSSISSRSAGPGTRANIDEFTQTTARAIETVGGARRGKAIIILNPADPPLLMRNTVLILCDEADRDQILTAVQNKVAEVQAYVPGYRLKQSVQVESFAAPRSGVESGTAAPRLSKVSIFLEVRGAAHYLPDYAGNLDIMTSAALATAERIVRSRHSNVKGAARPVAAG
jgi:acetaldehyde dehydrogenase